MIEKIISIMPEWLKFLNHSNLGEMLKIDKTLNLTIILKKLQDVENDL